MDHLENVQAVIETAKSAVAPIKLYEGPGFAKVYIPGHNDVEGKVVDVDLAPTLPAPVRKRGTVTVFSAAAFNQVIADNSDAGNISIYLDRDPLKPSIVAVLNGHGKGGPGWADFRVQIAFRPTPQWTKWAAIDGKMMPQAEFAEFIEDNLVDISDPAAGKMLEIVTYLEMTRSVEFKSGIRLPSGTLQFVHIENDEAKVSKGAMDVPEKFTLTIQPMLGSIAYDIPARFRYRLLAGKLTLGFKIERLETLMDKLVEDIVSKIERGANISVLDGLPPA